MEVKNSTDTVEENKNTRVNVTSMFENVPFSWITLQQNSNYKNVISVINQLLSMYHPDDGIIAYEHVLKTLLVLSENFDNNMRHHIISIIPFPKGASDTAIKNIIYKATDLIRSVISDTNYQNIVPENKLSKVNIEVLDDLSKMHSNQNILVNASKNLEFVPSVPEVFRGFPPNEISMIHSHVKNVNCVYNILDNNIPCVDTCINIKHNSSSNINEQEELLKLKSKLKWFCTPHLLYRPNFYQASVPHTLHQSKTCFKKQFYTSGAILNKQDKSEISTLGITHNSNCFPKLKMSCETLYNEDMNQEIKKCNNNIHNSKLGTMQMSKHFAQALKNEQIIQQDIHKMDVVYSNEKRRNTVISPKMLKENDFITHNFVPHKRLKTSLYSFLKRSEQETLIELPTLPQFKPLHMARSITKYWNMVTEENLKYNKGLDLLLNTKSISKHTNTLENTNKCIEKKLLRSLHIYPKSASLQMFPRNSNSVFSKTQTTASEEKDNIKHLQYRRFTVKQTKQNDVNTITEQAESITELTTFKKQCYDTLLNVQKAKVAVANSMAFSCMESSIKCDPCYSSHSYQQRLSQQHEQLTVYPQFAMHSVAQSELSNMYNTPYPWIKYNDWRHPRTKQLRFPQENKE